MKPSTEVFLREINEVCKKHGKQLEPQIFGKIEICDYQEDYIENIHLCSDFSKGDE